MDPPTRPLSGRHSVPAKVDDRHNTYPDLIRDPSPSPVSPLASLGGNMSTRSSRPRVTTSLRRWGGAETQNDFNLEEECIERKTVTTITTIQRSYPSIQVRPSRPLKSLDVKEYPLAQTPTPAELSEFSYQGEGGTRIYFREGGRSTAAAKVRDSLLLSSILVLTSFQCLLTDRHTIEPRG